MVKRIVTLDDTVIKGLMRNTELYATYPFLEKQQQAYAKLLKSYRPGCSSCSRRDFVNKEAEIINRVRNTIRTLPLSALQNLKSLLKADTFKITVVDDMSRKKVYTI